MLEVAVIDTPSVTAATVEPLRARLLHELVRPASASMLAARLGLSRQKVNYYLRGLEKHGLMELAQERRKGNMTERVMQATAGAYVISPSACSPTGSGAPSHGDHGSPPSSAGESSARRPRPDDRVRCERAAEQVSRARTSTGAEAAGGKAAWARENAATARDVGHVHGACG